MLFCCLLGKNTPLLSFASESLRCPWPLEPAPSPKDPRPVTSWVIGAPHTYCFYPFGHLISSTLSTFLHSHPFLLESPHSPFKITLRCHRQAPPHLPRRRRSLLHLGAQSTLFIRGLRDMPPCLVLLCFPVSSTGRGGRGGQALAPSSLSLQRLPEESFPH